MSPPAPAAFSLFRRVAPRFAVLFRPSSPHRPASAGRTLPAPVAAWGASSAGAGRARSRLSVAARDLRAWGASRPPLALYSQYPVAAPGVCFFTTLVLPLPAPSRRPASSRAAATHDHSPSEVGPTPAPAHTHPSPSEDERMATAAAAASYPRTAPVPPPADPSAVQARRPPAPLEPLTPGCVMLCRIPQGMRGRGHPTLPHSLDLIAVWGG